MHRFKKRKKKETDNKIRLWIENEDRIKLVSMKISELQSEIKGTIINSQLCVLTVLHNENFILF